ncbi:hypothetical protein BDEG_28616, partial [Batrachochytrium dendrobatidis JEL423]
MFVSTVSLVLALATSAVFAVPTIPSTQDASDSLPFYFPESTYQQIPYEHSFSLMAPSNTDPVKTGVAYLCDKLNLAPNEFKLMMHVYPITKLQSISKTAKLSHILLRL